MIGLGTSCLLVVGLSMTVAAASDGIDLHRLWDDRCFECHGHAAEFARRSLSVADGRLRGRHPVGDLRLFLRNHYPADTEVDAIHDMLLAQADSQARFRNECSGCHETAARFVRRSLTFCGDVLCSGEPARPIRDFLARHRALDTEDVEFYAELLMRVAREVYRP